MKRSERRAQKRQQAGTSVSVSTSDSFRNLSARLGYQTQNLSSAGTYGLQYISHNRQLLENMYTGSWITAKAVDVVAEDMCKKGIEIDTTTDPSEIEDLMTSWRDLKIWESLTDTLRWSRLYGGAIAVILIKGQQLDTPLRIETVGKDQFKGLLVLDRWMCNPSMSDLVTDYGPELGKPKYYEVVTDGIAIPRGRIHHSRCIRIEGQPVPYYRRLAELGWGVSIVERMFDRVLGFDSTSTGIAQLVYKAHLRTLKIEGYRDIVAQGGPALEGVQKQLEMIRLMQTNEGLTVLDSSDQFENFTQTFSGLDNVLIQMGQQLSGSTGIPLVKLFGQSPAGLNSTGESDLENYYGEIEQGQETKLRSPIHRLLDVSYRSLLGHPPPDDMSFRFRALWSMSDTDKANIAGTIATAVSTVEGNGIIDRPTALSTLAECARITGYFTSITPEAIEQAKADEPPAPEMPEPEDKDASESEKD